MIWSGSFDQFFRGVAISALLIHGLLRGHGLGLIGDWAALPFKPLLDFIPAQARPPSYVVNRQFTALDGAAELPQSQASSA
jgi:hypothetical protein